MERPRIRSRLVCALLFAFTFATCTLTHGPVYAAAILAILAAHELGHYAACRRCGVPATLPVFIPMPNLFGTLGAVIAIRGRIPDRKALFDIGAAGPLAGLALAIPAIALGISWSTVGPRPDDGATLFLGEPLLFRALARLVKGPIPETQDLFLHPFAFAGWAALFVTSINLVPAGQLDGGHLLRAMAGPRTARWVSLGTVGALAALGHFFHPMSYVFAALVVIVMLRATPLQDDTTKLPGIRWLLGLALYLLMGLCFTPVPIVDPPIDSGPAKTKIGSLSAVRVKGRECFIPYACFEGIRLLPWSACLTRSGSRKR